MKLLTQVLAMPPEHKQLLDVAAIGTLIAYLASWLPAIATVLTIVWTAIRIYETETFKKICGWVCGFFKRE